MANTDIFLGSGASITKVPELDFYAKITTGSAGSNITTVTLHAEITGQFSLVNDLYIGCIFKRYDASNAYQTSHRITGNTATTITFTPKVDTLASDDYFVIDSYGAPCPAPKVASGGSTHTSGVTTVTFTSDVKTDYDDTTIVLNVLPSEGGTEAEKVVFIDHDASASYSGGIGSPAEADISGASNNTREEYAAIFTTAVNTLSNVTATRNGTVVTITNNFAGASTISHHLGLSGSSTTDTGITFTSTLGTTVASTGRAKLLADTWLGITESVTFPTTEIEMKQTNLSLGGSRNWTYQYKGIETAGAADLNLVANHGSWLYYFFGKCNTITVADSAAAGAAPSSYIVGSADSVYLETDAITETGPLFRRTVGTVMTPPVNPAIESHAAMHLVTAPAQASTTIQNAITYDFKEQDGDLLPSFALEQVFSKLTSATDTYVTETDNANESLNFVKIARGCRVNTLTLTANENEELKMQISANTRNVHTLEKTEAYEARNGIEVETSFFNFTAIDGFREPFFFSDGTFKIFNEPFLKITTLSLTLNNSLTDKRFFGVGSKNIQEAIPAQRTYELSFTGYVTDNLLYNELINNNEQDAQNIELKFAKSNGEEINLEFSHYMLSANDFPMADDKGPIEVTATVMPRKLSSCTVKTHWQLQG